MKRGQHDYSDAIATASIAFAIAFCFYCLSSCVVRETEAQEKTYQLRIATEAQR